MEEVRTSNNGVVLVIYCCLLPQCEALRASRLGSPMKHLTSVMQQILKTVTKVEFQVTLQKMRLVPNHYIIFTIHYT